MASQNIATSRSQIFPSITNDRPETCRVSAESTPSRAAVNVKAESRSVIHPGRSPAPRLATVQGGGSRHGKATGRAVFSRRRRQLLHIKTGGTALVAGAYHALGQISQCQ